MPSTLEDIFGPVISAYTREQAIQDGVLIELSQTDAFTESGLRFPVAMTSAAYHEAVAVGGEWEPDPDEPGFDTLKLPGCQSHDGRLWDVFQVMLWSIRMAKRLGTSTDRIDFHVNVDTNGTGCRRKVNLKALVGPGDQGEPVITIMLPNED